MLESGSDSQGRVRTCENCVRAKIRCSRVSNTQSCDRCLRLHKECYFRPSKARNHKKRSTRIGALEDKVDQILGQMGQRSLETPPSAPLSPKSEAHEPSTGTSRHPCDVIGNGLISHEEASRLLQSFHDTIPYFPYVQLPRNVTIEDLRKEKPFLLLSILLVSSFQNVPLHLALEEVSTSYLGRQILQGDRSQQPLDTIQGLLVTVSGTKKKLHLCRFSGYLHLANSIIRDYRMDYPTKLRVVRQRLDVMVNEETPVKSASTQNEEMRALIGYHLMDSIQSVITQRTGTMPWSPFLESCAANLSQQCEFPPDQFLLGHIRQQRMLERVDSLVRRGFSESEAAPMEIEAMVRSLEREAKECKSQLPVSNDIIMGIQSHAFEIHLYQTTIFDVLPSSATSIEQPAALLRIDALCHGLAAAKQFIDFYNSLPLGIEMNFSYFQWVSTGFCLAASCKLVLASLEPSVRYHDQVKGLREAVNMPYELQCLAGRMDTIDKECKGGKYDQHEIFFYQEWLQHLSEWFEGQHRLAQSDSARENNAGTGFAASSGISDNNNSLYAGDGTDPGFPWVDLQDVTIEEMLNAWLGPTGMSNFP